MQRAMLNRATIPVADGTDVSGMRAMRLLISLLSFGILDAVQHHCYPAGAD
jgi:hypothetical protein